jgi:hypothetical protein
MVPDSASPGLIRPAYPDGLTRATGSSPLRLLAVRGDALGKEAESLFAEAFGIGRSKGVVLADEELPLLPNPPVTRSRVVLDSACNADGHENALEG